MQKPNYISRQITPEDYPFIPVPFKGDEQGFFDENGKVCGIVLKVITNYLGLTYSPRSAIYWWPNNRVKHGSLSKDSIIDGIQIKGALSNTKIGITFYESGSLMQGFLAADTTIPIGLYVFEFKKNSRLTFYENGNVWWGEQKEDTTLFHPYPFTVLEGDITFYPNGNILKCTVWEGLPFEYQGQVFSTLPRTEHRFHLRNAHNNVSLANVILHESSILGGFKTLSHHGFSFYPGLSIDEPGNIESFSSPNDFEYQNISIKNWSSTYLYETGSLRSFRIKGSHIIDEKFLGDHDHIELYENGKLKQLWVSGPRFINGVSLCRQSEVKFDLNGNMSIIRQTCPPIFDELK